MLICSARPAKTKCEYRSGYARLFKVLRPLTALNIFIYRLNVTLQCQKPCAKGKCFYSNLQGYNIMQNPYVQNYRDIQTQTLLCRNSHAHTQTHLFSCVHKHCNTHQSDSAGRQSRLCFMTLCSSVHKAKKRLLH